MTDDSDASGWGGIADEYQEEGEDRDETTETNRTSEMTETNAATTTTETNRTTETTETGEASASTETNIKEEWNGRTVYLPDDLVDDVDLRFDELALEAKRAGEEIKKNRDFYPAVFRAALNETSIEEELGLEDQG